MSDVYFDPILGKAREKDDAVIVNSSSTTSSQTQAAPLETKDEGTTLTTTTTSYNFTGSGVTATAVGNDVTVDVSGGTAGIPQYSTDPVAPSPEDAWVLREGSASGGGTPLGLLLSLTEAGISSYTYKFSYRTLEGTTKRVTLS